MKTGYTLRTPSGSRVLGVLGVLGFCAYTWKGLGSRGFAVLRVLYSYCVRHSSRFPMSHTYYNERPPPHILI